MAFRPRPCLRSLVGVAWVGFALAGCAPPATTPGAVTATAPSPMATSGGATIEIPLEPTATPQPCYRGDALASMDLAAIASMGTLCFESTSGQRTFVDQAEAAQVIRAFLEDPGRVVAFREITRMGNSPTGQLVVARFVDGAGRSYLVAPLAGKLLEIDPGSAPVSASGPSLSLETLRAQAESIVRREFPGWDRWRDRLVSSEGSKDGGLFFFRWEAAGYPAPSGMPPLAQVGLTASGEIFSYLNTLFTLE